MITLDTPSEINDLLLSVGGLYISEVRVIRGGYAAMHGAYSVVIKLDGWAVPVRLDRPGVTGDLVWIELECTSCEQVGLAMGAGGLGLMLESPALEIGDQHVTLLDLHSETLRVRCRTMVARVLLHCDK